MHITLIGHSTLVIECAGKKVLTDPYFGTGGNPAYMRTMPPAKPREACHNSDVVLVSHHHWDHVDRQLLRALPAHVPVFVPKAAVGFSRLMGARKPVGLGRWETQHIEALSITAVPAHHYAITHGFVIAGEEQSVYFAGDTFYGAFMEEIGRRFELTIALLPVTTFRIPMTMGEKGAVHAVRALKPRIVIPIHLDVQPRMPFMRTGHTPEGFSQRLRKAGLDTDIVHLKPGETYVTD